VSSVDIETRFGVPRYEVFGVQPLLIVGERYLWDGQELVPTTTTGPCVSTSESETGTLFRLRKEGRFARIVRCGANTWDQHWEVTEKDGTRFVYGLNAQARVANPLGRGPSPGCPDQNRNIGRWLLQTVVDASGNRTEYTYVGRDALADSVGCARGPGEVSSPELLSPPNPAFTFRELQRIEYTFGGASAPAPNYAVELGLS